MEKKEQSSVDKQIWQTVQEQLQVNVSVQTYDTWLADTKLVEVNNNIAKIACKNSFIAQALENRYYNLIKNALNKTLNGNIDLVFTVQPGLIGTKIQSKPASEKKVNAPDFGSMFTQEQILEQQKQELDIAISKSNLNPKYTFDTFIVGSANRLAHAAALSVVDKPGLAYNPLFIYGGVGLGKTHLMQAVGNGILKKNPKARILYTSTEAFLNEIIGALRNQKMEEMRAKFRLIDVLMIDDVQFISGKEFSQEEFFNTFNVLHQSNKQIICTSDRPPEDIPRLEDRVRSRLAGGLVADVGIPDYETRVSIIQRKLLDRQESLPDPIINVIAELVESNIRELEGALTKILTHFHISDSFLSTSEVSKILGRDRGGKKKNIKPKDIILRVSEYMGIGEKEILSESRQKENAMARQMCMYIMKKELDLQLVKIADALNRKDHTTIMHGINKIETAVAKDRVLRDKIGEIRRSLRFAVDVEEA